MEFEHTSERSGSRRTSLNYPHHSADDQARPNRYIDAGVYSMTDDQLYDIIGEIVIETGFQGMVSQRVQLRAFDEKF